MYVNWHSRTPTGKGIRSLFNLFHLSIIILGFVYAHLARLCRDSFFLLYLQTFSIFLCVPKCSLFIYVCLFVCALYFFSLVSPKMICDFCVFRAKFFCRLRGRRRCCGCFYCVGGSVTWNHLKLSKKHKKIQKKNTEKNSKLRIL